MPAFGLWVCPYDHGRLAGAVLPTAPWLSGRLESAGLPPLSALGRRTRRASADWRITAWLEVSTDGCQYQECSLAPFCEELRVQREYYSWPQDSTYY